MFIRRKRANGKTYYSLVENRRDPETGKVKQRHVMHLPTPRTLSRITEAQMRAKFPDQQSSAFQSIGDAINWYEEDYRQAKAAYRGALTYANFLTPLFWEQQGLSERPPYGKSDFEKFERLRAEVFKWYRILQTLKGAPTKDFDTERDRRHSAIAHRSKELKVWTTNIKARMRHDKKIAR